MSKLPFVVNWTRWDRTNPVWRPINKFQRCETEEKAKKLKILLESQTKFIEVFISKELPI